MKRQFQRDLKLKIASEETEGAEKALPYQCDQAALRATSESGCDTCCQSAAPRLIDTMKKGKHDRWQDGTGGKCHYAEAWQPSSRATGTHNAWITSKMGSAGSSMGGGHQRQRINGEVLKVHRDVICFPRLRTARDRALVCFCSAGPQQNIIL